MPSITSVMMLSMLMAATSFSSVAAVDASSAGGITSANVSDIDVKAAAAFAIKTLNQAGQNTLRNKLVGVPAGLLVQTGIKSATKQVVAGLIYGLLITGQSFKL